MITHQHPSQGSSPPRRSQIQKRLCRLLLAFHNPKERKKAKGRKNERTVRQDEPQQRSSSSARLNNTLSCLIWAPRDLETIGPVQLRIPSHPVRLLQLAHCASPSLASFLPCFLSSFLHRWMTLDQSPDQRESLHLSERNGPDMRLPAKVHLNTQDDKPTQPSRHAFASRLSPSPSLSLSPPPRSCCSSTR